MDPHTRPPPFTTDVDDIPDWVNQTQLVDVSGGDYVSYKAWAPSYPGYVSQAVYLGYPILHGLVVLAAPPAGEAYYVANWQIAFVPGTYTSWTAYTLVGPAGPFSTLGGIGTTTSGELSNSEPLGPFACAGALQINVSYPATQQAGGPAYAWIRYQQAPYP